MKKTLLTVALFSSLLLVSCGPSTTTTSNTNAAVITGSGVDLTGVPIQNVKGNAQSSVVLVEFSDLQCPACKNAEPSVQSIMSEFGTRIRFEYRYFPLKTIHKNAEASAYAAEAASRQGKFWEMHDKLFATQDEWAESDDAMTLFNGYAKELGLDTAKFAQDAASPDIKAVVARDEALGEQIGIDSTPTFYLNGKRLRPTSFSEFSSLVREAVLNQK